MARFNEDATHVVTQIEYGSEVYIELVHTGRITVCCSIQSKTLI